MFPTAVIRDITDFIFVEHAPEKADIIFVPGASIPDHTEHAAKLYKAGYAPYVLPSGRYSITNGKFLGTAAEDGRYAGDFETEWDFMRHILTENGVPEEAILKENQATYTYQNAIFSREVCDKAGITVKKAILACQATHARRALSYYRLCFPQTEFIVCPVATKGISRDTWYRTEAGVDTVLGELARCGSQFGEAIKEALGLR